ncbi:MAG: arsenite methyltransferase [Chloroflexi bacterium]|nr:arsenite methyltransferase [Chloroflexota bacterium]
MDEQRRAEVKEYVRQRYGAIAKGGSACCGPAGPVEVTLLPASAAAVSTPLGCGNPTAIASLKPGEAVLDLGSGPGLDCLLAAQRVGPTGRVIGVDMTPEMLELARESARRAGAANVEYRQGDIEALPVDDSSVDVIVSNCVINLAPDKDAVFREAFRVLKRGGRLCVADIVALEPLDEALRSDLSQWSGCISGALEREDYRRRLQAAGFVDVAFRQVGGAPGGCSGPVPIASMDITARKPG